MIEMNTLLRNGRNDLSPGTAICARRCYRKGDIAPKIHFLPRLAEIAKLKIREDHKSFLGRFDRYQIMGRYPDCHAPRMDPARARQMMKLAEEIFQWLTEQF